MGIIVVANRVAAAAFRWHEIREIALRRVPGDRDDTAGRAGCVEAGGDRGIALAPGRDRSGGGELGACGAARLDQDDAGESAGAVARGGGAADDRDLFDIGEGDAGEVGTAAERGVDGLAVDDDQDLAGARTADRDERGGSRAALPSDEDTGDTGEERGELLLAGCVDRGARDRRGVATGIRGAAHRDRREPGGYFVESDGCQGGAAIRGGNRGVRGPVSDRGDAEVVRAGREAAERERAVVITRGGGVAVRVLDACAGDTVTVRAGGDASADLAWYLGERGACGRAEESEEHGHGAQGRVWQGHCPRDRGCPCGVAVIYAGKAQSPSPSQRKATGKDTQRMPTSGRMGCRSGASPRTPPSRVFCAGASGARLLARGSSARLPGTRRWPCTSGRS